MGIRFIYGRAGSGKSTYCLNSIKNRINDNNGNRLIYLVPEQYTFQRETMLLKDVGEEGLLRAQVLSFKTMAQRVFEECGGRVHDRMRDALFIKYCKKVKKIFNILIGFQKSRDLQI